MNQATQADHAAAYRIPNWCALADISRTTLYDLWKNDKGPERRQIQGVIYIIEHPAEWVRRVGAV